MKDKAMIPTENQIESLRELMNIGVGRGASVLNSMLSSHIQLQVPFIKIISPNEIPSEIVGVAVDEELAVVDLKFKGKFSGNAQLIFPAETASALVITLVGEDSSDMDLDSIRAGTLTEVGNVVLNGLLGSIANILELNFTYSVPSYFEERSVELFRPESFTQNDVILMARTRFVVERLDIEGDILIVLDVKALGDLLNFMDSMIEN